MTETLRNRNRTRGWSDVSDIIDEELDTPTCRVIQIIISIVTLCISTYFVLRLI